MEAKDVRRAVCDGLVSSHASCSSSFVNWEIVLSQAQSVPVMKLDVELGGSLDAWH